jgi:hypothetical protein
MLQYKCDVAGVWFEEVNEAYSTQTCSGCNRRTGPKGLEVGSLIRQKNGRAAHVERYTTVTSTQPRTFSRPGMAVSQEESPPLPRQRQPVRANGGEEVNKRGNATGLLQSLHVRKRSSQGVDRVEDRTSSSRSTRKIRNMGKKQADAASLSPRLKIVQIGAERALGNWRVPLHALGQVSGQQTGQKAVRFGGINEGIDDLINPHFA